MKTKLCTLALLLMSAGAFAQTAADEARSDVSAVRNTLDTETLAFHEANGNLLRAQWSTKPYAER